jgi:hypothetical protein
MFCLDVVIVSRCISTTNVFLWGSSWFCIDVFVLLACRYVIAFSRGLCFLCCVVLCLLCGGCESETEQNKGISHTV